MAIASTGGLAYIPGGGTVGGLNISAGGNTSGTVALVSAGTLILAGGNNVTLSQQGNNITISANTAAAATLSISAGSTSGAFGGVTFPNSNGITFGLNNGTITGSINSTSGAGTGFTSATTAGTAIVGTLNSSGLSLGIPAYVTAGVNVSASGNTSGTLALVSSGTLILAGGNNVTLSQNGNSITISGANAGGAQTAISGLQVSNNTFTSGTVTFQNANGITFGSSGANGISASYNSTQFAGTGTTFAGTNVSGSITLNSAGINLALSGAAGGSGASTGGIYAAGNTTGQSSSSTFAQSSLNISLAGVLSGGWSSNSFVISSPGTTGLTQLSAGFSTGGNTAGTSGLASAQLVLAGGNNITLSGSTNAGSMTVTVSGAAQTNQTVGLYALGNTTQNSSTTLDARTLSFNGLGEITVGYSNGSIQLSAPPSSLGVSTGGNTSGNTGTFSGQAIFVGGNNITLSVGTAAGGAQTITISAPNQTNQTLGLYGVGNTTQNSSTTLDARTVSFDGLGAMTVGFSNGSVQLSAPATSSLSATGQVSISVNASTISIGAPNYGTLSYWDNGIVNGSASASALGLGSVIIQQVSMPANLSVSALREYISASFSATNSSYGNTISVQAGIYTLNGSTLSLATSGSQSYGLTNTSNNSASIYTGVKGLTLPLAASMTPGNYWIALWSSTASSGFNFATFSNVVANEGALTYNGLLGSSAAGTNQAILGAGTWSTTSNALPSSIGLSQISGTVANFVPYVNMYNVSA